jgi:hypothetical protein
MSLSLMLALTIFLAAPLQAGSGADSEGFIRSWLVMAPIPLEGDSGTAEIDTDFLGDEATVAPKAGEKLAFDGRILTWTPYQAADYFIDFLQGFGHQGSEFVAAYAVVYVWADDEMAVTLAVGTNDEGKAWLNGKEVVRAADPRSLDKDADRAAVTLARGRNVLVLKVINETNNWQACARFLKDGAPVRSLRFTLAAD